MLIRLSILTRRNASGDHFLPYLPSTLIPSTSKEDAVLVVGDDDEDEETKEVIMWILIYDLMWILRL